MLLLNLFLDVASDHVEGGLYIGPEFQLGQVYDGTTEFGESIVLYRPVYITVVPASVASTSDAPSGSTKSSTKVKPQKSSLRNAPTASSASNPSTSNSSKNPPTATDKKSKPHRSSEKAPNNKMQRLNALAIAPPSLQSIAKKRSSLPDSTKNHNFDSLKPFTKFEFSSFKKDIIKKVENVTKSEIETIVTNVEDESPQPCTSAQAMKLLQLNSAPVNGEKNQLENKDNEGSTNEKEITTNLTGDKEQ